MIRFLIKGLLRDRSRSLFPVLVVAAGAFLAVFGFCWIKGTLNDILWANAAFDTGHVKIMTNGFAAEADLLPNDLALIEVDSLLEYLRTRYPSMIWTSRTRFGSMLDIPDSLGETRAQAPVMGLAIDLSETSPERRILHLENALVRGRLPQQNNEMLISELLAEQLGVSPGEVATLIGSTAYGSLTLHNFTIAGTIRFGVTAMDRSVILVDEHEARLMLDMENASSEIVGYFPDLLYKQAAASSIVADFNSMQTNAEDSPHMFALHEQNELESMLIWINYFSAIVIGVFIVAMSIVLWNAGLMGSLRRYGEFGLRLAIGESKLHVYQSLLAESLIIGFIGGVIGTALGLAAAYYLQVKGLDISGAVKGSNMLLTNVIRAQITPAALYVGLIPGLIAPPLGTAVAGIGIFKRQTAQLFKELEV
ncbi:MAG: FtsX-like permease family protein [candidate division KSB1 bacterium]|nr:FtsX-like permease family protein [candidate division KSB1 bacterium]